MRFFRRSRLKSSRGHVRVDQGLSWMQREIFWVGGITLLLIIAAVIVTRMIFPRTEDEASSGNNRTWLEFAWTVSPVNSNAVQQLGERLRENGINQVYLEAAAWRTDGSLHEGEYTAEFVEALHAADPQLRILLWLRMSGEEISQPARQTLAVSLAGKAVRQWEFDGVQLNGRAVLDDSETYIQLVRALRDEIGSQKVLSLTVPPDRIPSDPDIPVGSMADPRLTWSVGYKQRVGLLQLDEIVVMAHASGLDDSAEYRLWVAYQLESYAETMTELERPPEIIVALPTYDAAPEHDPVVEGVRSAIAGVKEGLKRAGKQGKLVTGVGLYEYKSTDSLEWALYGEHWLGIRPK